MSDDSCWQWYSLGASQISWGRRERGLELPVCPAGQAGLVPGGGGPSGGGRLILLSQRFCTVGFCDQNQENCNMFGQEKKRKEARERMARTEKGGFQ